ncbi:glutamine-hydrolyzing carbamoyl-phosphate synthase small subunit [bacterium]|jgi:carbamoyl-phosphate synthase small subunit|nr:glutamine-hydrolyzing carbamoyl-phosphate synthase small subunit [bacterium]MBT6832193.1 glutamine-hydrolyzing carbamoyl-phosphate synthase small subunit [bacterium]MBT6996138.1 glutamine-hydrolyzing carbamoyl-phosphate synthase small subunit [bacterium]MBT7772218.1 glutamine-hydrolyzing carbamoyl-phosphate synthase small subunit [bacterium]
MNSKLSTLNSKLFLASGEIFGGTSFGAKKSASGEVVFCTGMTGYLEILTDPSYFGQIVVFTFPQIGNYGVFPFHNSEFISKSQAEKKEEIPDQARNDNFFIDEIFESKKIWARGVIVAEASEKFSHALATSSFGKWLEKNDVPAIAGVDTRKLTQILREHGTVLGAISETNPEKFSDPLDGRFVPEVSPEKMEILEPEIPDQVRNDKMKTIAFLDCGAKNGIFRNFLKRGIRVIRLPFDADPFACGEKFDGIFFSNGPGDPEKVFETIATIKKCLAKKIPTFGICLGCQILALAAGGKTKKMKYGHRSANQPVRDLKSGKCLITTQNHGFVVDKKSLPDEFEIWFENLNDKTVEGIRHKNLPISAVQFHPESCAGPEDAEYLFDEFVKKLK